MLPNPYRETLHHEFIARSNTWALEDFVAAGTCEVQTEEGTLESLWGRLMMHRDNSLDEHKDAPGDSQGRRERSTRRLRLAHAPLRHDRGTLAKNASLEAYVWTSLACDVIVWVCIRLAVRNIRRHSTCSTKGVLNLGRPRIHSRSAHPCGTKFQSPSHRRST